MPIFRGKCKILCDIYITRDRREGHPPPDRVQSDVVSDPDDGMRITFDNKIFLTLSHLLRSWLEVRGLGVGRLTVGRGVGVAGVGHVQAGGVGGACRRCSSKGPAISSSCRSAGVLTII